MSNSVIYGLLRAMRASLCRTDAFRLAFMMMVLLIVVSGCTRSPAPASVQGKPAQTLLITNYGEFIYDEGPWKVSVSAQDGSVSAAYTKSYAGDYLAGAVKASSTVSASVSPEGWRATTGWFAFVESSTRLWAYDGITNLWVLELTNEGSAAYGITSLPVEVPSEIAPRLSPQARKLVESALRE